MKMTLAGETVFPFQGADVIEDAVGRVIEAKLFQLVGIKSNGFGQCLAQWSKFEDIPMDNVENAVPKIRRHSDITSVELVRVMLKDEHVYRDVLMTWE